MAINMYALSCYCNNAYASSHELRYKITDSTNKRYDLLSIVSKRLNVLKNTNIKFTLEKIDNGTVKILLPDATDKHIKLIKNILEFNKRLDLRLTSPKSLYKLPGFSTYENAMKHFNNVLPPKTLLLPQPFSMNSFDIQDHKTIKSWHLLSLTDSFSPTIIASKHFKENKNNHYSVACKIDTPSVIKLIKLSTKAAREALLIAFTFDNKIICIVACNSPIVDDSFVISGHFDENDASHLAAILNSGPMRHKAKLISEQSIK